MGQSTPMKTKTNARALVADRKGSTDLPSRSTRLRFVEAFEGNARPVSPDAALISIREQRQTSQNSAAVRTDLPRTRVTPFKGLPIAVTISMILRHAPHSFKQEIAQSNGLRPALF